MVRITLIVAAVMFTLFFMVNVTNAQGLAIIPNVGIAKIMGDNGDLWNLGFTAGVNVFYPTHKVVSFGGRIAYLQTSPKGEEILNLGAGAPLEYEVESTSGSFSIIEIVPSIQIATSSGQNQTMRLACQVGGGIFMLSQSEVSAKGVHYSPYGGSVTSTTTLSDVSETKPGVQFGVELSYKRKLVLQPLYSMIFTEENTTSYASVNLGFVFGK